MADEAVPKVQVDAKADILFLTKTLQKAVEGASTQQFTKGAVDDKTRKQVDKITQKWVTDTFELAGNNIAVNGVPYETAFSEAAQYEPFDEELHQKTQNLQHSIEDLTLYLAERRKNVPKLVEQMMKDVLQRQSSVVDYGVFTADDGHIPPDLPDLERIQQMQADFAESVRILEELKKGIPADIAKLNRAHNIVQEQKRVKADVLKHEATLDALEPDTWQMLVNALLGAIDKEYVVLVKSGASASGRKHTAVEQASKSLRDFVDVTCKSLPNKCVKTILAHIVHICRHRDTYREILLVYVRMLTTITSFRPHSDHLSTSLWQQLFEVCTIPIVSTTSQPAENDDNSDDDYRDSSSESSQPSSITPKKRAASASPNVKVLKVRRSLTGIVKPVVVSEGEIDYMSWVNMELMQSLANITVASGAPLRLHFLELLDVFRQFFTYSPGSSMHHITMLSALNHCIREEGLNHFTVLKQWLKDFFPILTQLWQFKYFSELKLQAVILCRFFIDYVVHPTYTDVEYLNELRRMVDTELMTKRGLGIPNLATTSINLTQMQRTQDSRPLRPFQRNTFRGSENDCKTWSLSWLFYEFATDVYAACLKLSDDALASNVSQSSLRSSYSDIFATIDNVMLDSTPSRSRSDSDNQQSTRIGFLQLLMFLFDKYPAILSVRHERSFQQLLLRCLRTSDPAVFHWSCMAVRTLCFAYGTDEPKMMSNQSEGDHNGNDKNAWDEIFSLVAFRIHLPAFCESSCMLLTSLIDQCKILRDLSSVQKVVGDISNILATPMLLDFNLTTCEFFHAVLNWISVNGDDAQFQAFYKKILAWFLENLRPLLFSKQLPEWLIEHPFALDWLFAGQTKPAFHDDCNEGVIALTVPQAYNTQLLSYISRDVVKLLVSGEGMDELLNQSISAIEGRPHRSRVSAMIPFNSWYPELLSTEIYQGLLEPLLADLESGEFLVDTAEKAMVFNVDVTLTLIWFSGFCLHGLDGHKSNLGECLSKIESAWNKWADRHYTRTRELVEARHTAALLSRLLAYTTQCGLHTWTETLTHSTASLSAKLSITMPTSPDIKQYIITILTRYCSFVFNVNSTSESASSKSVSSKGILRHRKGVVQPFGSLPRERPLSSDPSHRFFDIGMSGEHFSMTCIRYCLLCALEELDSNMRNKHVESLFCEAFEFQEWIALSPILLNSYNGKLPFQQLIQACANEISSYRFEKDQWVIAGLFVQLRLYARWKHSRNDEAAYNIYRNLLAWCSVKQQKDLLPWRLQVLWQALGLEHEMYADPQGDQSITLSIDYFQQHTLSQLQFCRSAEQLTTPFSSNFITRALEYKSFGQSVEQIALVVLMISQYAVFYSENRIDMIYKLLRLNGLLSHTKISSFALSYVAKRLGFKSAVSLARYYSIQLLMRDVRRNFEIMQPALGCESLSDFLRYPIAAIVIFIEQSNDAIGTGPLSQYLTPGSVRSSFALVFAWTIILTQSNSERGSRILEYLQETLGTAEFEQQLEENVALIVVHMLETVEESGEALQNAISRSTQIRSDVSRRISNLISPVTPRISASHAPRFPFAQVEKALVDLSKRVQPNGWETLFNYRNTISIWNRFHEQLEVGVHLDTFDHVKSSHTIALGYGWSWVHQHGVFSLLLHRLVHIFGQHRKADNATYLRCMMESVPEKLFNEVCDILLRLIPWLTQVGISPDADHVDGHVAHIVEVLFIYGVERWQEHPNFLALLENLPPFPVHKAFEQIRHRHTVLATKYGFVYNDGYYNQVLDNANQPYIVEVVANTLARIITDTSGGDNTHKKARRLIPNLIKAYNRLEAKALRGAQSDRLQQAVANCVALALPFTLQQSSMFADLEDIYMELDWKKCLDILLDCGLQQNVKKGNGLFRGAQHFLTAEVTVPDAADLVRYYQLEAVNNLRFFDTPSTEDIFERRLFEEPPAYSEHMSAEEWRLQMCAFLLSKLPSNNIFVQAFQEAIYVSDDLVKGILPTIFIEVINARDTSRSTMSHAITAMNAVLANAGRRKQHGLVDTIVNLLTFLQEHADANRMWPTLKRPTGQEIDYLHISEGACKAQRYQFGIRCLEIGINQLKRQGAVADLQHDHAGDLGYASLAKQLHFQADDLDTIYGFPADADSDSIYERLKREARFTQLLAICESQNQYEMQRNTGNATSGPKTLSLLTAMGLHSLALAYDQTLPGASSTNTTAAYQSAWRLQRWDIPNVDTSSTNDSTSLMYKATKTFSNHVVAGSDCSLENIVQRTLLMTDLRKIREITTALTMLELSELACADEVSIESTSQIWAQRAQQMKPHLSFPEMEVLYSTRQVALTARLKSVPNAQQPVAVHIEGMICANYLDLCQTARRAGNLQVAANAVYALKSFAIMRNGSDIASTYTQISKKEEAKLFWANGEIELAISMLKDLVQRKRTTDSTVLFSIASGQFESIPSTLLEAKSLSLLGAWLAEANAAAAAAILKDYLKKASTILGSHSNHKLAGKVHYRLAQFADQQYEKVKIVNIEDLERSLSSINVELEQCRRALQNQIASTDAAKLRAHARKLEVQRSQDVAELEQVRKDVTTHFETALLNYINCLIVTEKYDLQVFRICRLWFSADPASVIHEEVKKRLLSVASYKCVAVLVQLSTLLDGNHPSLFQDVLRGLLARVCGHHPYHGLYQLFALRNAGADKGSHETVEDPTSLFNGRIKAAKELLQQMAKKPSHYTIIRKVEKLCAAYINLAHAPPKPKAEVKPGAVFPIPRQISLAKAGDALTGLPIITVDLPVSPNGDYEGVTTVVKFDDQFQTVGGINIPKSFKVYGSDGKEYRQLVKRDDDIRQDALMQQVFAVLNTLLRMDSAGRARQLSIRTYKALPLASRCGIIEWVQDAVTLGEWLSEAHPRLRPEDWSPKKCRIYMHEMQKSKDLKSVTSKQANFRTVCKHIQPVLRYFFLERFKQPSEWFNRKLAYTRSVASTSMVGYVVGIGDRHPSNILLDTAAAEVVHIDFGIAFDAGKFLSIPETVPFRLTRDMVDGMGYTGVEGVFKRSSEVTFDILRKNSALILTILEVFRLDPLHNWSVPLKRANQKLQRKNSGLETDQDSEIGDDFNSSNKRDEEVSAHQQAERVLAGVQKKLSTTLSTSCLVNELVINATDEQNLCKLYSGETLGLLLALLLVLGLQGAEARLDAKQRADALVAKAKASKGGLIEFDAMDFDEFTSKPRRYGLVLLLTAMSPEFRCTPCKEVDPEYKLVASSFQKTSDPSRLFFGYADFMQSSEIFMKLGLKGAPNLLYYPPTDGPHGKIGAETDVKKYDFNRNGLNAEGIADFLSKELGIEVPVRRPPNYMGMAMTGFLVIGALAAAKLVYEKFAVVIQSKRIWAAVTLIIILLMTSGHMWNHIRKPPYVVPSQDGISYIASGFQQQFGMESQLVAMMYAILSFCIISLATAVPRLDDPQKQRFGVYMWSGLVLLTFSILMALFRAKNGSYPFKLLF
ncbi:hypothetical protein BZG36_02011 [Bifiguratus adelaidae]|uniref:Serine/threonine-protein kinase TEL1 n=1 Tax=Bifiguratus adelaidae TaxID=1938954 RepID=A0A261Y471_9FUNG|nr:hypothetical protein BZG36_02011 [Bifiguratus adelaidae]